MGLISVKYHVLFITLLTASYDIARCDAISNTSFNSHIRDYAEDNLNNITHVKTLQKEDIGRYATFSPTGNPITFKEIPDSALSSTSNGRGLYHDQPGYSLNDYEEGPHYTYEHDYHVHDAHPEIHGAHGYEHDHEHHGHNDHHDHHGHNDHHDHHGHNDHHDHHNPHGYDHQHHYSVHHHLDHGHYNKHFKHALAAKTVLWPLAGIALLGAAAAFVSNPVLLQLGVVSGKRKRRDTEEITGSDFSSEMFKKFAEKIKTRNNYGEVFQVNKNLIKNSKKINVEKVNSLNESLKRRILKTDNRKDVKINLGLKKIRSSVKEYDDQTANYPGHYNNNDDDRFIPIPIKLRSPNIKSN